MAGDSFLDPEWYRVAALKPRLRASVELHRHRYRGQVWHVAQDAVTGRFHRFSAIAWYVIGLMDGGRTAEQIWQQAGRELGDDAPTQREMIRLLHQLHVAELLRSDVAADPEELAERRGRQRRSRIWQTLRTPLAIRIPLVDPERLLEITAPVGRALFSWVGFGAWLLVMVAGLAMLAGNYDALTQNLGDRLLSAQNLALLWLTFPIVKVLHELGHGWAVKRWGGEVHEMGLMLLVFTPVPYVDASQATALRSKRERAVVGLAGMMVELALAALALFVWVAVEPGWLRALCYNTMIIAGVSTILFNGNPLLRFDAYYVLADLIEIPNLAGRGNQYCFYLVQRYLFGLRDLDSPAYVPSERPWLVGYAVASFVFRMFLYFSIVVFVSGQYFLIGVLLAIWSLSNLFLWPLAKGLKYLLTSARLARRRPRAIAVTAAVIGGLVFALALLPLPYATVAEGVVWVPDDAMVRPEAPGVIRATRPADGAAVGAGEALLELDDPLLPAEVALYEAALAANLAQLDFYRFSDPAQANIARQQVAAAGDVLARARERNAALSVESAIEGRFYFVGGAPPLGRFVERGRTIGYVLPAAPPRVRAVVTQGEIDAVRSRSRAVQVRLVQDIGRVLDARIVRVAPAGTTELPSPALGTGGGGRVAIDARTESLTTALDPVFEVRLELPAAAPIAAIGSRVYVRFDHGYEPLAWRWYRDLRRLFLRRLQV